LNIPNTISLVRIAATPVLVLMLLSPPGRSLSIVAAVLFALVCLTDWLDGFIARRWKMVTTLGKFLDPLADKLLIVTTLIMLIQLGRAPAWVVALMVGREIAVTGLRSIAVDSGVVIAASPLGKMKTVSQIFALIPLILHYSFYGINFHSIGVVLLYISLALTLWSGYDYFMKFFRSKPARGA
jgi:CDP-diacylglycerol--glycerol-3-phosphate 3-phosphatidyltransferase